MTSWIEDYGCPECGYDGPHPLLSEEDNVMVVECGGSDCGIEFEIRNLEKLAEFFVPWDVGNGG